MRFGIFPSTASSKTVSRASQISSVAVDQGSLDIDEAVSRIQGLNTEDVSIKDSGVFNDVRISTVAPGENESIRLVVNVEAQKTRILRARSSSARSFNFDLFSAEEFSSADLALSV